VKVDDYMADTVRGGGIAKGSKDMITDLLYADFINGMNEEFENLNIQRIEKEAKESESIIEKADNCFYALYEKALDKGWEIVTGEKAPVKPPEQAETAEPGWDFSIESPGDDGNAITGALQVKPPDIKALSQSGGDSNYALTVDDKESSLSISDSGNFQIVNGRVKFKLVNRINKKIVAQKDYNFTKEISKDFSLSGPAEVSALTIVEVIARVPAKIGSKIASYEWLWFDSRCIITKDYKKSSSLQFIFRNPSGIKPEKQVLSLDLRDVQNNSLGLGRIAIVVKPVQFKGSLSGHWEGGPHPKGIDYNRIKKSNVERGATVSGNVVLHWCEAFCPETMEELEKDVRSKKGVWGRSEFREIKIGNLKGFMVETPGVMSEGSRGSPDTGWYSPTASATGWGFVMNECIVVELSYAVSGAGRVLKDDEDLTFLKKEVETGLKEVKSFLGSITLVPDGTVVTGTNK